jgi:hypothetical protein
LATIKVVTDEPYAEAQLETGTTNIVGETIKFIELLPPEFVARKDSYYAIGLQVVQGPVHIETHIDQIRSALNFAKV